MIMRLWLRYLKERRLFLLLYAALLTFTVWGLALLWEGLRCAPQQW